MNDKLNIKTQTGTDIETNVICYLENIQNGKRYLYYTLNEIVGTGANSTVKVYVSKLKQNDPSLDEQITEDEWKTLKDIMAEVLKGIGSQNVKYLSTSEISDPVSVSDRVIAMPVSYDYINKHRGIYAQAVATAAPTVTPEPVVTPEPIVEPEVAKPVEPVVSAMPVEETTVEPVTVAEPQPVVTPVEGQPVENSNVSATPIDLNDIEQKYNEMIETVNRLKEQELEAAKRYNATIELSAMHNEQHANYVANEQIKENVETPTVNIPVEPEAVTPIVPEPVNVQPTNPTDIETNWFDMPAS